MRIAYLDCFSGIAGDMFLGALVHAGLPLDALRAELSRLGLDREFTVDAQRVWREAMEGIRFEVRVDAATPKPRRGLSDIRAILAGSALDPAVKEQATAVFTRLARAEAKVHGTTEDEVHFHEVGAVDAIVDVVGVCAGLRLLGVEEVRASSVPLGSGFANCEHGRIPVPVPASLELLRGVPVRFSGLDGELVTPTGAALLTTLATRFDGPLSMVPAATGYGFGSRERPGGPPNALRVILGDGPPAAEEVLVLETHLDDATGQEVGFLLERLLDSGALDAFAVPIQMKKSRPGLLVSVLAEEHAADAVERVLFQETPTLGVRRHRVSRTRLDRRVEQIETALGAVRVKFARGPHGVRRAAPEHDDVARIAREHGMTYRDALQAILRDVPPWPA